MTATREITPMRLRYNFEHCAVAVDVTVYDVLPTLATAMGDAGKDSRTLAAG